VRRSRSDKALTYAICVSLLVHATLGVTVLRERIAILTRELYAFAAATPVVPAAEEDEGPAPAILPPAAVVDPNFEAPRPPPPPPAARKPRVTEENSEWGEKDASGFAITSSPGARPMAARKGVEDQAFASRDAEGPQFLPEDPSLSTALPGENGDGRKPMKEILAGKGTEGTPEVVIGRPDAQVTPPAPVPDRSGLATAENARAVPQTIGVGTSILPAAERRSPAEAGAPVAAREGLYNDPANGQAVEILPIKRPDMIGVRSNEPAYPEVVAALTRPPGVKFTPENKPELADLALPNVAPADELAAPAERAATVAMGVTPRPVEEMARLVGENEPTDAPAIVEALTYTPGAVAREGGAGALPEIALAEEIAAPAERDAIVALSAQTPRVEETAEVVPAGAETPAVASAAAALSAANAVGGLPGPAVQAADPAPDTGLESDPFAKIPSVEFNNGAIQARSGRQVKPVRPRLSEAGRRDLLAMQFPTILCKVRIDKTGKVTDVRVVRGSGSEAVDMPVYRALFQWYFEPPKDKTGNPLEDVQLVAIHWG
jgi:TonB family protein